MEVYRDLIIELRECQIGDLVERMSLEADRGALWTRRYDLEDRKTTGDEAYAFHRRKDDALPAAGLSLFEKDEGRWYVPNVVPLEYGFLSYQQYNELLAEFAEIVLEPVVKECGVEYSLSQGEISDIDLLGQECARLLRAFSSCANKSTGSAHPMDRERWLAFIAAAPDSNSVSADDVQRLLEEQGWDEDSAYRLAVQFEFGQELIEYVRAKG